MKVTITLAILCIIGTVIGLPAFVPVLVHTQPWRIFTSVLMHSGAKHIIYNLIGLFMFGLIVEKLLGWKWYTLLIFVSIAFSTIGYMLLANPFIGAIGVSGVVFGLIGALAVLKPKMIVYTPYGPLPMIIAAIAWVALEIVLMGANDHIAHSAHLFGLIGGATFSAIYKINKKFTPLLLLAFVVIFLIPLPQFPIYKTNCNLTSSKYEYDFSYTIYNCSNYTAIGIYVPKTVNKINEKIDNGKYFLSELGQFNISKMYNSKNAIEITGAINGSKYTMEISDSKYTTLYLVKVY